MDDRPDAPAQEAGEVEPTDVHDRLPTTDGGQGALVPIPEGLARLGPTGDGSLERLAGVDPHLDRPLGDARNLVAVALLDVGDVPDHPDIRSSRDRKIIADRNGPAGRLLQTEPFGDGPRQRTGGDSRPPDDGPRADEFLLVSGHEVHTVEPDVHDPGVGTDLDPVALEGRGGEIRGPLRHRRQHAISALDQDDPGLRDFEFVEFPGEAVDRELLDRSRDLDPGRAGPDHHEGEPFGNRFGLPPDPRHLGLLERIEHPGPHDVRVLEGLESGGHRFPVVAVVVGPNAGRDHEVIPGDLQLVGDHHASVEVETFDLGLDDGHVSLVAEHSPERCGDRAVVKDSGRHLVEERLEERVVASIEERDVNVRSVKHSDAGDAAKAPSDDHDPRSAATALTWVAAVHGLFLSLTCKATGETRPAPSPLILLASLVVTLGSHQVAPRMSVSAICRKIPDPTSFS